MAKTKPPSPWLPARHPIHLGVPLRSRQPAHLDPMPKGLLMSTTSRYPEPGSEIPGQPGYVVGRCGHRVAGSEWKAGFRTCERCPAARPSVRGGDPIGHAADHDYRHQEQNDRD